MRDQSKQRYFEKPGDRTKRPNLSETKSQILETGQNRRFRKWDKIADFKVGQNRRF